MKCNAKIVGLKFFSSKAIILMVHLLKEDGSIEAKTAYCPLDSRGFFLVTRPILDKYLCEPDGWINGRCFEAEIQNMEFEVYANNESYINIKGFERVTSK